METTKSFTCCGGSDESPPEHTQDCPDFGDPKWLTKLHESEMKFVGEQLTSSKARIASLEAQLDKAEAALKFYADEDKYFVRTKIIDPQKDIIFASRYDEEKGESVPVDLKEPFESKSFEVTARLKVDQGKTAQTYFAEKEKNEQAKV